MLGWSGKEGVMGANIRQRMREGSRNGWLVEAFAMVILLRLYWATLTQGMFSSLSSPPFTNQHVIRAL